ncbi:MAG TPA: GDP-mannose 4,6-dehydratase [Verrucomicrobiae bacterium]
MSERFLVTGGAGFIGSHLVDRLVSEGHSVTIIDDLSTGNLANLSGARDRVEIIQSKVSDCKDLQKIVQQCSGIFHLAAAVGVDLVIRSPIETIRTNLDETEVILEAASETGVPILIASTSEVYGKSQKAEFAESDDLLIGPPYLGRWSYACSKLMDEFLALSYFKERKLPVTIARLFNTVGPRQTGHYGMVLPRFIAAAKSNKPLGVFGDGQQTRCFCYVADTVEALLRLHRTPTAHGEVVNIGSSEEISITNLAQRVIELTNSKSKIEYIPYDRAYTPGFEDMLRRKPSIEKLARLTGFRPKTSLNEIIQRTAS